MSEQVSTSPIHQQPQQQQEHPMHPEVAFARPNPLDIPELLQLISSFLRKRDVATCLCVSRDWYRAFLPSLWATLELNLDRYFHEGPPLPNRKKYWSLVRKLLVKCSGNFKMPCSTIKCPNLTHLEVLDCYTDSVWRKKLMKNERSLASLIHGHQSSLKVYVSKADTTNRILKALSECAGLEKLGLDFQCFNQQTDWIEWYNPLWSRVESLSWRGAIVMDHIPEYSISDIVTLINSVKSTKIKDLDLSDLGPWPLFHIHVLLITKSPDLRRLRWETSNPEGATLLAKVAETVPFGKHLKDLLLFKVDLRDGGVQKMLDSLPKLARLEVHRCILDMEVLGNGQTGTLRFLTIIKVLNLTGWNENSGKIVQAAMCTIPGLEELTADYICDRDIMESGAQWVCTGLRRLQLAVILLEKGTQDMILDLLSSLVNLTLLNLSVGTVRRGLLSQISLCDDHCLRFSLRHGLDRLRTLRQMVMFKGPGRYMKEPDWTVAEAQWALEHWVHLKSVSGVGKSKEAETLMRESLGFHML